MSLLDLNPFAADPEPFSHGTSTIEFLVAAPEVGERIKSVIEQHLQYVVSDMFIRNMFFIFSAGQVNISFVTVEDVKAVVVSYRSKIGYTVVQCIIYEGFLDSFSKILLTCF